MIRALSLLVLITQTPVVPLPATAANGLIAGRVVDGVTGRPVSGAVVTLVVRPVAGGATPLPAAAAGGIGAAAAAPLRLLVDGDGKFQFTSLRPGVLDLSAAKRGYVSGAPGKLRADGAGQIVTLIEGERRPRRDDSDLEARHDRRRCRRRNERARRRRGRLRIQARMDCW